MSENRDAETTAIGAPSTLICGTVKASCLCVLRVEHGGSHACTCGGRWLTSPAFRPVALPMRTGAVPEPVEDDEK